MRLLLGLCFLLLPLRAASGEVLSAQTQNTELLPSEPFLHLEVRGVPPNAALRSLVTLGALEPQGITAEGAHRLRWIPPASRVPAQVRAVFWIPGEGPPELAGLTWSLVGRTALEVETEPQAEVRVQIGTQTYGPRTASNTGQAVVPIEVRHSDRQARVIAKTAGQQTVRHVPLSVPPSHEVAMAFSSSNPAPRDWVHLVIVQTGATASKPVELTIQGAATRGLSVTQPYVTVSLLPAPKSASVAVTARRAGANALAATAEIAIASDATLSTQRQSSPADSTWIVGGTVGAFVGDRGLIGPLLDLWAGRRGVFGSPRWELAGFGGFRYLTVSRTIGTFGTFRSSVTGLPLGAALRLTLVEAPRLRLRAGLGLAAVPFFHNAEASFQPGFLEHGIGWEAYGALQLAVVMAGIEPFVELRGGYGGMRTPRLQAHLGIASVALGLRYAFPGAAR